MPRVSIVYPTARYGGFDVLMESINRQTFKDFEVLIIDELKREGLIRECGWVYVEPPFKKEGMWWNLDQSLNKAISMSIGEIIVELNDYLWLENDSLEKLIKVYDKEGPSLVCGVGHQYSIPSIVDVPNGLFSVWNTFPGKPSGSKTFTDPRVKGKGVYVCTPVEWEANFACFAKEIWQKIGGYDEEFDLGWGYDNVNFAERAQMAGYNTFVDMDNEVFGYSHINLFDEQKTRDSAPNNQKLWYKKYQDLHYYPETAWKLDYARIQ